VVAASGSTATIVPKWPHFSLPPTGPGVHFACRLRPSGEISRLHSRRDPQTNTDAMRQSTAVQVANLGERSGPRRSSELKQVLCAKLRPGDVVVLDNLSAHKVTGIREQIGA
jgi:hypothetical protein